MTVLKDVILKEWNKQVQDDDSFNFYIWYDILIQSMTKDITEKEMHRRDQ